MSFGPSTPGGAITRADFPKGMLINAPINIPSPAYTRAVEAVRNAPKGTVISRATDIPGSRAVVQPTKSPDIPGTIVGIVLGSALAPFNPQAKAEYVVQGATKGITAPLDAASSGIGGVVGFASLGESGLKKGVEGGVGAIPGMITESAEVLTDSLNILGGLGKYILIGGAILIGVLLLTRSKK